MGLTESGLKILTEPLSACISDVLGSFDCTCRSNCCENFTNCYSHCRTIESNEADTEEGIVLDKK